MLPRRLPKPQVSRGERDSHRSILRDLIILGGVLPSGRPDHRDMTIVSRSVDVHLMWSLRRVSQESRVFTVTAVRREIGINESASSCRRLRLGAGDNHVF